MALHKRKKQRNISLQPTPRAAAGREIGHRGTRAADGGGTRERRLASRILRQSQYQPGRGVWGVGVVLPPPFVFV